MGCMLPSSAHVVRSRINLMLNLFVETHNNGSHDITLLEVPLWTGRMSIMAGHAGIRDGEVRRKSFKLVPILKRHHAGGWIGHESFQSVFLRFRLWKVLFVNRC